MPKDKLNNIRYTYYILEYIGFWTNHNTLMLKQNLLYYVENGGLKENYLE